MNGSFQVKPFFGNCRLVDKALSLVAEHKAEFMIASHNQESIEKATKLMYDLDLPPQESPVYFGQLLGMADPLSFVLGANGYKVGILLGSVGICSPVLDPLVQASSYTAYMGHVPAAHDAAQMSPRQHGSLAYRKYRKAFEATAW